MCLPLVDQTKIQRKEQYRVKERKQVPARVWDFLALWICETGSLSVLTSHYAKGRTPLEIITGETPDISEYLDFGFCAGLEWPIIK